MGTVNLTAPTDYASQLQDIERRRKMAEMLQQQGMSPMEQNPTAGGYIIPTSWTQGLAKVLQSGLGAYQQQKLGEEQKGVVAKQAQSRSADLAKLLQAGDPTQQTLGDPSQLGGAFNVNVEKSPSEIRRAQAQALLGSSDPQLQQAGLQFAIPPKPTELAQGGSLIDENGQPIARGEPKRVPPMYEANYPVGDGTKVQPHVSLDNGQTWQPAPGSVPSPKFAKSIPTIINQQAKTPQGYRETADGNLEAIPGGPADQKLKGKLDQDTSALNSSTNSMDRLAAAANALLNHPGLPGTTGVRGAIPNIPGTAAADAAAAFNTLKSQVAFGVLQDMRNNSKTGGALGQVSDKEGQLLQSNLAALDKSQSLDQMKHNLQQIIDYANGAKDRLRDAYNMKHGDQQPEAPQRRSTDGQPVRKYNPATGKIE